MLVLSRKVGEKIVIGDQIVVTVLEVKGRQMRLGIEAPANVSVWRGEIKERQSEQHVPEEVAHAS